MIFTNFPDKKAAAQIAGYVSSQNLGLPLPDIGASANLATAPLYPLVFAQASALGCVC